MTQTQEIHNQVRDLLNGQPVFIQTSIIEKLDKALAQIDSEQTYDKRFTVAKNLNVLVYTSGTVEIDYKGEFFSFAPTHRGRGYTKATILTDRLPSSFGQQKFIGYLPHKDEWIIASKFLGGGYGWSKYFMTLESLVDHLEAKGFLSLAVDAVEHDNLLQLDREEA